MLFESIAVLLGNKSNIPSVSQAPTKPELNAADGPEEIFSIYLIPSRSPIKMQKLILN